MIFYQDPLPIPNNPKKLAGVGDSDVLEKDLGPKEKSLVDDCVVTQARLKRPPAPNTFLILSRQGQR